MLMTHHGSISKIKSLANVLWTPAVIGSSLIAWWDPTTNITLSGSNISSWKDKIGSLTVSQSTSSNQPTFSSTARNNSPGLIFSGSQNLYSASSGNLPIGSSTSGIFVTSYINKTKYNSVISHGPTGGGRWRNVGQEDSANNAYGSVYGYQTPSGYVSYQVDRSYLCEFVSGSAPAMFVDGNSSSGTSVGSGSLNTGSGYLYIGSDYSGTGNALVGSVQHILVFNRILTTSEKNKLFGWESWNNGKNGSNLPTSHPYKTRAPYISDP